MKRIAIALAVLGLVAGRALADDKAETKMEHKEDTKGAKTTVESKSTENGVVRHDKAKAERHVKADGKVETKRTVTHKQRLQGRLGGHTSEVKKKTVTDAQGNVVEQHKTVKQ